MHYYFFLIPVFCALTCAFCCLLFFRFAAKGMILFAIEPILSVSTDTFCLLNPRFGNEAHNLFILLDSILLFFMARPLLPKRYANAFITVSICIFLAGWCLSVFRSGFSNLANYSFAVASLLITALYLIAFYHSETSTSNQLKKPIRLICLALVLYHCGTFVFFCGIPYLMDDNIPEIIIDINTVFDSLKYLLIAIAFYLFKKKSVKAAAI